MTKEEIAKRNCGYGNWEGIYKAMDEFAKQEAIGFNEWLRNNYNIDSDGWYQNSRYYTLNQLYQLFKGGEKQ